MSSSKQTTYWGSNPRPTASSVRLDENRTIVGRSGTVSTNANSMSSSHNRLKGPSSAGARVERIRLSDNPSEAKKYDDFADTYALLVAADRLERVWRRDAVTDQEYEEQCYGLIRKFQAVRSATQDSIPDIDGFYAEYNMNAAGGKYRLVHSKVPLTQEVKKPDDEAQVRHNIHCIQWFIGLLDNIELNQRSPDSLLNLCISLQRSLGQVKGLAADFPFLEKLKRWTEKLNTMAPTEDLSDEDAAQFKLDLSTGYNEYLHAKAAL